MARHRILFDRLQQNRTLGASPTFEVYLGLDSVELVMEVERHFELTIPDETAATLATVGGLFDYVATNSPFAIGETRAGAYYGPFWDRYCEIVSKEIGVERERLLPTARFVQDLGVD